MADVITTLKPPGEGGDYSDPAVWEATEQGDVSGNNVILECTKFSDGSAYPVPDAGLFIDGWTGTSPTSRIIIRAAADSQHGGVEGAGVVFESQGTDNADKCINNLEPFFTVDGLQLNHTTDFNLVGEVIDAGTANAEGGGQQIFSCIIVGGSRALYLGGFNSSIAVIPELRNCLILGSVEPATLFEQVIFVNNNIIGNCEIGIRNNARSTNTVIQNNYADSWAGYSNAGAWGTLSNNASGDGFAPGTSTVLNVTPADFADYAGGDYAPVADGALDGTGVDLSTSFTTDITGATRTVPWTIGAYIVAGGPPPVGIQEMYIMASGIFVKYTPYVKVGGTFQEVDAYVLEGGTWVPVHEK